MPNFPIRFPIRNQPVHVNYRLYDSVPRKQIVELQKYRDARLAEINGYKDVAAARYRIRAEHELAIDDELHRMTTGPMYLRDPLLAKEILDSWRFLDAADAVRLLACCVMSNHVHVVLGCPDTKREVILGPLMGRHKRYTARVCNRHLGRTRQAFWEPEYFDRGVRRGKFMRVMWYVLNNPVEAGLVGHWSEWTSVYVHPAYREGFMDRVA